MSRARNLFDPRVPIEKAPTPPAAWYIDEEMFQEEIRCIFQKSWIAMGRRDQVRSPGDYFTGEIVGNPFVVVRDDEGKLGAFHNVCRHHAALVAQECGSCSELVCPYHGWTYRLNGSLKKAPRLGRLEDFDVQQFGLAPISVETWGPFVLLDLDGPAGGQNNPRDLQADIAPIRGPLEELGLDHMKWVERRVYKMNCNWKVFVDNSLDGGYHVAYAHEGLAEGLEFQGYATEMYDRSAIQICETRGTDMRLGEKVMYAWLFPNFFINRYGRMMDTNLVMPLTVDTCVVYFDFYFDYENLEEWKVKRIIRKAIDESDVIQREDHAVCESAQQGMRSMSFSTGRYSSLLERAVHDFHIMLWNELADD